VTCEDPQAASLSVSACAALSAAALLSAWRACTWGAAALQLAAPSCRTAGCATSCPLIGLPSLRLAASAGRRAATTVRIMYALTAL